MADIYKIGAMPLGYYGLIASWRTRIDGRYGPSMVIASAASTDEGVHEPAQSITLNTRESMLALRDAIDQALELKPDIKLIDMRAKLRLALVMMRDFGSQIQWQDSDTASVDWGAALKDFEAHMDHLVKTGVIA